MHSIGKAACDKSLKSIFKIKNYISDNMTWSYEVIHVIIVQYSNIHWLLNQVLLSVTTN